MRPKPSGMGYTIPPWKKEEYAAQNAEIEAMRKAEKERKTLRAEAAQTLRTTVEETKKIEQANAKIQINKVRTECD